jgi:uncharacterized heparinase superfamily protein
MSRGVIAERARLSLFVIGRSFRGSLARLKGHRLLRWRYAANRTDRLLIAPPELRTADPTRASEIYAGRFVFAGKVVVCDSRSPFEITPPSDEWTEVLAGFGWLRHLKAADSNLTRNNARSLVEAWLDGASRAEVVAKRPDVTARRLMSWLMNAPFLLDGAEPRFYTRFMRNVLREARYLSGVRASTPDGLARLQVLTALTYAGVCLAGQMRLLKAASRRLADELDRQVLPDGGHISRNPGVLIELLLDLLPLRQAFGARNLATPPALVNAIERMMPMLRFFRHSDGAFANFNGMGPTRTDQLATVLAYDDARGRPVENATHSGYQRLEAAGAVIIMDTGKAPPLPVSFDAHAGCLAFELSSGRHRIVVNCGLPAVGREVWRHHARLTVAHSTLCVGHASSCRFVQSARLQRQIGVPIVGGPTDVPVHRERGDQGAAVAASHDGYAAQFGLVHERHVVLADGGRRVDGEDSLRALGRSTRNVPPVVFVRFHLHPSVRAARLTHREGVLLTLPNRDVWTFECLEGEVSLEDSVFLAGRDGPRHTKQIVVKVATRGLPRIAWSFVNVEPAEAQAVHRVRQQELPL